MWGRFHVPAKSKLSLGNVGKAGFRAYLAIKGGFPEIPAYLGSKSTSMGLGGYQVSFIVVNRVFWQLEIFCCC